MRKRLLDYTVKAILVIAVSTTTLVGIGSVANPAAAVCPAGQQTMSDGRCVCPAGTQQVSTSVDAAGTTCIPINKDSGNLADNPIFFYLRAILQFLSAGIGLIVAGGFITGGLMYITARANAGQVEKAKLIMINSVIALILFIFMYTILQFIIPGGVFS